MREARSPVYFQFLLLFILSERMLMIEQRKLITKNNCGATLVFRSHYLYITLSGSSSTSSINSSRSARPYRD